MKGLQPLRNYEISWWQLAQHILAGALLGCLAGLLFIAGPLWALHRLLNP